MGTQKMRTDPPSKRAVEPFQLQLNLHQPTPTSPSTITAVNVTEYSSSLQQPLQWCCCRRHRGDAAVTQGLKLWACLHREKWHGTSCAVEFYWENLTVSSVNRGIHRSEAYSSNHADHLDQWLLMFNANHKIEEELNLVLAWSERTKQSNPIHLIFKA